MSPLLAGHSAWSAVSWGWCAAAPSSSAWTPTLTPPTPVQPAKDTSANTKHRILRKKKILIKRQCQFSPERQEKNIIPLYYIKLDGYTEIIKDVFYTNSL